MIVDCPKCKEPNISYKQYNITSNEIAFVFRCNECGTRYRIINGTIEKQIGEVWMAV